MKILILIIAALLITGCADSVSFEQASNMSPVGFLHGLWHGMIMLFSFIGSLFSDDIAVYAIYNNGGWYDFGFLLGLGAFAGGSTSGSSK